MSTTVADALRVAVLQRPQALQQWKRGASAPVAKRIEEHAYRRVGR